MFSNTEIHQQLSLYKSSLKDGPKLYFAKFDVQKAFDNIHLELLLDILDSTIEQVILYLLISRMNISYKNIC